MSIKSNVVDAVLYLACSLPIVIPIVLLWRMADNAKVFQPAANEVANKPVTTETEVYKVVCTSEAETFCKEYSVRRINKE